MKEQDPIVLLQKAKKFVRDNLFELSLEVLKRKNSENLPLRSKFHELSEICSFAGHSAMSVAENLVYTEALIRISEGV